MDYETYCIIPDDYFDDEEDDDEEEDDDNEDDDWILRFTWNGMECRRDGEWSEIVCY
jgi:hypothetical protein